MICYVPFSVGATEGRELCQRISPIPDACDIVHMKFQASLLEVVT